MGADEPPGGIRPAARPDNGADLSDYAIFMLDPAGRVVTWNAGAERIKGYKADEIIGQHFSALLPAGGHRAGWPAHELEVAAAEGRFEDEGWRVRKDGSRFWANVVITALRDETAALVGFAKVTRDLTERKRAEDLLAPMAAHLRACRLGRRDRRCGSPADGTDEPRLRPDAWVHGGGADGKKLYDVFAPSARPGLVRQIQLVHEKGHHVFESEHLRKDGTVFPVLVDATAVRDEASRLLYRAVRVRDLHRTKARGGARALAEAKFRGLLEASHDAIIIAGKHGTIEFANTQALRSLAATRGEDSSISRWSLPSREASWHAPPGGCLVPGGTRSPAEGSDPGTLGPAQGRLKKLPRGGLPDLVPRGGWEQGRHHRHPSRHLREEEDCPAAANPGGPGQSALRVARAGDRVREAHGAGRSRTWRTGAWWTCSWRRGSWAHRGGARGPRRSGSGPDINTATGGCPNQAMG